MCLCMCVMLFLLTQHLNAGHLSPAPIWVTTGFHKGLVRQACKKKIPNLVLADHLCVLKENPVLSLFGLLLPDNVLKMQCTSTTKGWAFFSFLKKETRTGPYSHGWGRPRKGESQGKMGNKCDALLSWSSFRALRLGQLQRVAA